MEHLNIEYCFHILGTVSIWITWVVVDKAAGVDCVAWFAEDTFIHTGEWVSVKNIGGFGRYW